MKCNWTKTLHLVRGLPGSGKNFLANDLVGHSNFRSDKSEQVIDNDSFYMHKGKYVYDEDLKEIAGWWCFSETFRRFRKYDVMAVPNVFAKKQQVFGYVEVCKRLEINVVLHHAKYAPSTELSFQNNIHRCPMQSIEQMNHDFEHITQQDIEKVLYDRYQ